MAMDPTQAALESSGYFFPNQSPEILELELKLRKHVAELPEPVRLGIYEVFARALPSFTVTDFAIEKDFVVAKQASQKIAFPRPVPLVKLSHIVFGYEQWLQRKYCLPGFVEVEAGDIVVDCGAYVGGFSISASKIARAVHAFEPDEHNFRCLWMNHSFRDNVTTNVLGLYNVTKQMELNISANSVEHSLLAPDDGPPIATRKIMVVSLKDYFATKTPPTFIKIEAEGVELEVYDGLGSLRPRKFAIDVSPERDGQSPVDEFMARLPRDGYETQQRGNVLFARLKP
jgi:FkbM family methyltransferase